MYVKALYAITLEVIKYLRKPNFIFTWKSFQCWWGKNIRFGNVTEQYASTWSKEEVDTRLHEIMIRIHDTCITTADRFGFPGNYVVGANIAGFLKVADAMLDQGLV